MAAPLLPGRRPGRPRRPVDQQDVHVRVRVLRPGVHPLRGSRALEAARHERPQVHRDVDSAGILNSTRQGAACRRSPTRGGRGRLPPASPLRSSRSRAACAPCARGPAARRMSCRRPATSSSRGTGRTAAARPRSHRDPRRVGRPRALTTARAAGRSQERSRAPQGRAWGLASLPCRASAPLPPARPATASLRRTRVPAAR